MSNCFWDIYIKKGYLSIESNPDSDNSVNIFTILLNK